MVIVFTVNCVCLFVLELFIERHFAGWFLAPVCRHTSLPPNYMAVFGHPLYEPTTSASRCTRACIHLCVYMCTYIHTYVHTCIRVYIGSSNFMHGLPHIMAISVHAVSVTHYTEE